MKQSDGAAIGSRIKRRVETAIRHLRALTRPRPDDASIMRARFITVTLLTAVTAFTGWLVFPDETQSSDVSAQSPLISVVSDNDSIASASIRSIHLTNLVASIQLSVTTGASDANIYVVVEGPEFDDESRGQGWTLSRWNKNIAFTKIPLKKERAYDSIEVAAYFSTCNCFEYEAPYLYATSAVYTGSLAAVGASQDNMKQWPSKFYELPTSQVEQIQLDLTDQELPTTWDAIEEAPSSPTQLTDNWWIWKDSNYGNVRLRSVDEVSDSEHRTFLTGLLLGVAGAGLFIVIDSIFPLLAIQRGKRKSVAPEQHVPESDLRLHEQEEESPEPTRRLGSARAATWVGLGIGIAVAARYVRRLSRR
ncbi:hypothetical protein ACFV16_33995 [Streptomyces massasporeus]|uniref:hypothetical protein n=1 Tax=Streptomyces massasporeus TaxID=67324 RepID=UPI00369A8D45